MLPHYLQQILHCCSQIVSIVVATCINCIEAQERKTQSMSNGREYIIGSTFEGIIQCVKSYGAFIDIGEDVGLLHISEISHVRVTFMEALFAFGEKVKVSFYKLKVQVIVIMIIFTHEV